MSETDKEYREEGRAAFLSDPYNINRNPYSVLGDEGESRKRSEWQDGWNDAQRNS